MVMSPLFGPLREMGFVVRDIEKAMRHWVEVCGVGPWFVAERLPLDRFWYKEEPHDIHVTVALANSGDVQLELTQQRDTTSSMYRDFLASGYEGLQH
jgi:Glyoxalase/Bleomycin resistance protein/Dioxygenase superfamily